MVDIHQFLTIPGPLYDVRSPGEFLQGTIPNSINLSLFSDSERREVGTVYKQKSPKLAFLLGLKFAGPKLASFAEEALQYPEVRVFCFRGGQRSGSMKWLFQSSGVSAITLKGGYKAFRHFVLEVFQKNYNFSILGGLTGSGKTEKLQQLKKEGHQIIDLEALTKHRGSVFGNLEAITQPTTESFENALACALYRLNPKEPIWIEDESRMIGSCKIPDGIFSQMIQAPITLLEITKNERLNRLVADYGTFPKTALIQAVHCLVKKLGNVKTKEIITFIEDGDLLKAASLLLDYYDTAYYKNLEKRK